VEEEKKPVPFWPEYWVWRVALAIVLLAAAWFVLTGLLAFTGWGTSYHTSTSINGTPIHAVVLGLGFPMH
jgi:hypothetical protein